MRERRAWVLGLLLLILAAGSWWLKQHTAPAPQAQPRPAHSADYWVKDLIARTMDEQGQPRQILKAATLHHYPDDDSTELQSPELLALDPQRPPWRVRSETGWVSPDGELVLLRGLVHIDREATADLQAVKIKTRDLRVQPKNEYAETEQPVFAESGAHKVQSVGLQAWLRAPVRIKLLSDVRGHYEAPP
jgi:lipopolysaccharide export system protein LptC